MRAVVVGAGIAGLTSTIALTAAGVEVEVVESARQLAEIGAGLSLWPNALAALGVLGLEEAVSARGVGLDVGAIRSREGRPAYVWDRPGALEHLGGVPLMMHRAELQSVLLDACAGAPIRLGARAVSVGQEPDRCRVVLDSGEVIDADLVVGADGVRSAVRKSVEPSPPRYAGLTSWRAVIDRPYEDGSSMWVAEGKQFLATALARDRTYISGLLRMPEGENRATTHWGDVLRTEFQGWDRTVTEAIDAIPEEGYYRDDIYYRPPVRQMVWGNVALVGDAAHPFTPDLGQGGCQAIEDAVTLGACLRQSGRLDQALLGYQASRLARVRPVARDSRLIGRLMASRNPLVASTRIRHALLAWEGPITAARGVNLRHVARHASRQSFLSSLRKPPLP
ncbi:MAG TPA: FAD-dependent monooxygenase [Acidimicrobiales bacterium]|nr:FAD-dependent monooxygenase [Acidimicrobiales bacterium]